MYKVLPIGGKDYKLEYTVEASLYSDCTEKLINFMSDTFGVSQVDETTDESTRKELIKNSITGISNIPEIALTMFYAGLLEYHGEDGDGSVLSMKDAKKLVKVYFSEHTDDGTDNFYDLLTMILEQMGEDGFFNRVGLTKMLNQGQTTTKKRRKTPTDHQRKEPLEK